MPATTRMATTAPPTAMRSGKSLVQRGKICAMRYPRPRSVPRPRELKQTLLDTRYTSDQAACAAHPFLAGRVYPGRFRRVKTAPAAGRGTLPVRSAAAAMKEPVGLLLVNLGTPDAPRPREVRRYLREF